MKGSLQRGPDEHAIAGDWTAAVEKKDAHLPPIGYDRALIPCSVHRAQSYH